MRKKEKIGLVDSIFGTHTVDAGYGFLAFFLTIFVLTFGVNAFTDIFSSFITKYTTDFWVNLGVGFGLSGLVYLDLFLRFYRRDKKK